MKNAAKFALASLVSVLSVSAMAAVTIDNFDVTQTNGANLFNGTYFDNNGSDGLGVWNQVSGPTADIIGGFRDIYVQKMSPVTALDTGSTSAKVAFDGTNSKYSFNNDSSTVGVGIIRWDGATAGTSNSAGVDGTWGITKAGFGATDVTLGATAVLIKVLFADQNFPFSLQIFSGATAWTELNLISTGAGNYFLNFSDILGPDFSLPGLTKISHGGGVDLTAVTATQVIINVGANATTSVDLEVDIVNGSFVPEPASLALVGLALLGVGSIRRFKRN